jgi:NhaP-type Na+/H+ or K+/H+ antiporter
MEGATVGNVARVVVEAIGIGTAVGLILTWSTVMMLHFAERRGWISEIL